MKLNKIFFILGLSLTLISANERSLDELIDIAMKNSVDIQVAKADIEAKSAGIDYASAGYLPQVSVQGSLAQEDNRIERDNVVGATASVDQLLYDFGGTTSNIGAAQSAYNASLKQLDSSTNAVVISVKKAYYDILNKNQLINVANEAVKIDELQLEQANEYFKAGVRTRIDVTNAELQLTNSKLDLLKAKFGLKSSNTNLISILGVNLEKDFSVKKDDTDISALAKEIVPMQKSTDELIGQGLEKRAEIAVYKANIDLSSSQVKLARSEYYPKILLNAAYNEKDSNSASLDHREMSAGVYIKWDIFSGFSTEAKVKENLANLTRSKVDLRDIELKITQEIINAYLEVKKSEDSTKMQLLSVDLATQNLSLAQQRYKAGLSDMVELNDAKLGYTKSKGDLVNTYYGYLVAVANLEYVTGEIRE